MYQIVCIVVLFLCRQKTAYEVRISDWSSDVCSSDLLECRHDCRGKPGRSICGASGRRGADPRAGPPGRSSLDLHPRLCQRDTFRARTGGGSGGLPAHTLRRGAAAARFAKQLRSEEHTSELPSLLRNPYAVFCSKKKNI